MSIRGDAPPRPADLAYELPIDFDIYALPDSAMGGLGAYGVGVAAVAGGGGGIGLSDFFAQTAATPAAGHQSLVNGSHAGPVLDESSALPDLIETHAEFDPVEIGSTTAPVAFTTDSTLQDCREMSLMELGKKRHREWLDSHREGRAW